MRSPGFAPNSIRLVYRSLSAHRLPPTHSCLFPNLSSRRAVVGTVPRWLLMAVPGLLTPGVCPAIALLAFLIRPGHPLLASPRSAGLFLLGILFHEAGLLPPY